MYGLINNALKGMIEERFGEDQWQQVLTESGVPEDSFLTMRSYDDEITYSLAGAASKVLDAPRGFVKIVSGNRYDEVLGVHIIGPHATELIAEASAALSLEATTESLFHAIHAHPTLSEAMGEAAAAVHGRAIHF